MARSPRKDMLLAVNQEIYRRSLAEFTKAAWSSYRPNRALVWNWHLDALCEHLEALYRREIKNLVVTMPFRMLKSTLVGVMFPAWIWAQEPEHKFLTSSYSQILATRDAVYTRTLIQSPWYQKHFGRVFQLSGDVNLKTRYENDCSGYRIVTAPTSGTTGEGGDLLLCDDPHDVQKVESATVRQATSRWYFEAFYNRFTDPERTVRLLCGQRTHYQDLFSEALATGLFDHLNMPMEFSQSRRTFTQIGWTDPRTQEGELIAPEYIGPEKCEELKKGMRSQGQGDYAWMAQANQDPRPREGVIFKRSWYKTFSFTNDSFTVGTNTYPKNRCLRTVICDPAGGITGTSKKTGLGSFILTPRNELLIAEVTDERIAYENIVRSIFRFCQAHGPAYCGIEKEFLQSHLVRQAMKTPGMPPVKGISTQGKDKWQRAQPAIIMSEAGQVYVPEGDPPWLGKFFEQLCTFTGMDDGEMSDMVDVFTHACSDLDRVRGMVGVPLDLGGGYGRQRPYNERQEPSGGFLGT